MEPRLQASPEKSSPTKCPLLGGQHSRGQPPSLRLKRAESQWSRGQRGWRRQGPKGSQEVVSHGLFGGDAPCLLGSGLKDDEIFLEMLVQLQDGCHIPTAGSRRAAGLKKRVSLDPHLDLPAQAAHR